MRAYRPQHQLSAGRHDAVDASWILDELSGRRVPRWNYQDINRQNAMSSSCNRLLEVDVADMVQLVQDPGISAGGGRQDGIIQDINRHAAVVMEGLPGTDSQQQSAQDVAEAVRLARQVSPLHFMTPWCP